MQTEQVPPNGSSFENLNNIKESESAENNEQESVENKNRASSNEVNYSDPALLAEEQQEAIKVCVQLIDNPPDEYR